MTMNHITVKDDWFNGSVEVEVLLDTSEGFILTGSTVNREDLRAYIEQCKPCVIWQDNHLMKLCRMPGCNELIPMREKCHICEFCITEYEPEMLAAQEPTSQYQDNREAAGMM